MKGLIGQLNKWINNERIFLFSPLPESTYMKQPCKLRNSMKALINIENNNNKFLWYHIRYLIALKIHLQNYKS